MGLGSDAGSATRQLWDPGQTTSSLSSHFIVSELDTVILLSKTGSRVLKECVSSFESKCRRRESEGQSLASCFPAALGLRVTTALALQRSLFFHLQDSWTKSSRGAGRAPGGGAEGCAWHRGALPRGAQEHPGLPPNPHQGDSILKFLQTKGAPF